MSRAPELVPRMGSRVGRYGVAVAGATLAAASHLWTAACSQSSGGDVPFPEQPDASTLQPDAARGETGDATSSDPVTLGIPLSGASVTAASIEAAPTSVAPQSPNFDVASIFGFSPSDIWLVGSHGLAAHYDGSVWTATLTPTLRSLVSVWGLSPTNIVAAGDPDTMLQYSTAGDFAEAVFFAPDGGTADVGASDGGLMWRNHPEWFDRLHDTSDESNISNFLQSASAVWAPSAEEFWIASGDNTVLDAVVRADYNTAYRLTPHPPDGGVQDWTGVTASDYRRECGAQSMWGAQSDDVWLAGCGGQIMHVVGNAAVFVPYLGPTLRSVPTETQSRATFRSVHGTSTTNVWAVGQSGTIRHWDGSGSWQTIASPATGDLNAIRVFPDGQMWVAGTDSVLITFDGAAWRQVVLPGRSRNLRALWGDSPDDMWVGGEDVLIHVTRSGGQK